MPGDTPIHVASHVSLLGRDRDAQALSLGDPRRLGGMDAVIVPAHRKHAQLVNAARAAVQLRTSLIVLCSGALTASAALEQVAPIIKLHRVRAIDVASVGHGHIMESPGLATDQPWFLADMEPVGHGDVSGKRNLGLLISRAMGWRAILFLDDDLKGLTRAGIRRALPLLNHSYGEVTLVQAVGWRSLRYPDNSVVCHGYRESGCEQDVFVGGGGLAVRVQADTPYFPNVYNEDWLFLHPLLARRSVLLGGSLRQDRFNPYDRRRRLAHFQEFGDVLGEGLFRLLHDPQLDVDEQAGWEALVAPSTEVEWWDDIIELRHRFLDRVRTGLSAQKPKPVRILRAITEAERRLGQFEGHHFARYVKLWIEDQIRWRATMESLSSIPRPLEEFADVIKPYGLVSADSP